MFIIANVLLTIYKPYLWTLYRLSANISQVINISLVKIFSWFINYLRPSRHDFQLGRCETPRPLNATSKTRSRLFSLSSSRRQVAALDFQPLGESLGKPSLRRAKLYSPHCGKNPRRGRPWLPELRLRWIASRGFVIRASELIEIFQAFTNSYRGSGEESWWGGGFFSCTCLCGRPRDQDSACEFVGWWVSVCVRSACLLQPWQAGEGIVGTAPVRHWLS